MAVFAVRSGNTAVVMGGHLRFRQRHCGRAAGLAAGIGLAGAQQEAIFQLYPRSSEKRCRICAVDGQIDAANGVDVHAFALM